MNIALISSGRAFLKVGSRLGRFQTSRMLSTDPLNVQFIGVRQMDMSSLKAPQKFQYEAVNDTTKISSASAGVVVDTRDLKGRSIRQIVDDWSKARAVSVVGAWPSKSTDTVHAMGKDGMIITHTNDANFDERSRLALNVIYESVNRTSKTEVIPSKRVGLIGVGIAAHRVAAWCKTRGMSSLGASILKSDRLLLNKGIQPASVQTVVNEADYLVVDLIALGPARHFLSTQLLAQCKKGCTLINVGDADAIDECALLEALNNNNQFAAVSLDLAKAQPWDREPQNLRQHPLVRVAPLPGSMAYDALDAYYREFDCDLFGDTHRIMIEQATERVHNILEGIGSDAVVNYPDMDAVAAHPGFARHISEIQNVGREIGGKLLAGRKIDQLAICVHPTTELGAEKVWSFAYTAKAALLQGIIVSLGGVEVTLSEAMDMGHRMVVPVEVRVESVGSKFLRAELSATVTVGLQELDGKCEVHYFIVGPDV